MSTTDRMRTRIDAGRRVPGVAPRIAAGLVGAAGSLLLAPMPFGVIGAVLAVLGAVFPRTLATWGAATVIALAQLSHPPEPGDWRLALAVAAVHLLHVLGALCLVVEPTGSVQLRVFRRPLLRWLMLQVPAQLLLVVVLRLEPAARSSASPALLAGVAAVVTAVAVGAIVVLLIRRR